jgi:hypothetical protein
MSPSKVASPMKKQHSVYVKESAAGFLEKQIVRFIGYHYPLVQDLLETFPELEETLVDPDDQLLNLQELQPQEDASPVVILDSELDVVLEGIIMERIIMEHVDRKPDPNLTMDAHVDSKVKEGMKSGKQQSPLQVDMPSETSLLEDWNELKSDAEWCISNPEKASSFAVFKQWKCHLIQSLKK